MIEYILTDYYKAYGLNSVTLRLFNVCGADPEHELGEVKNAPTHLLPSVMDTALGRRDVFKIFGTKYDTRDGTGVRDFIHIMDIAEGHLSALDIINKEKVNCAINLGTGKGSSVLDVIKVLRKQTGISIPFRYTKRRKGDLETSYCNSKKALKELNWKTKYDLAQAMVDIKKII